MACEWHEHLLAPKARRAFAAPQHHHRIHSPPKCPDRDNSRRTLPYQIAASGVFVFVHTKDTCPRSLIYSRHRPPPNVTRPASVTSAVPPEGSFAPRDQPPARWLCALQQSSSALSSPTPVSDWPTAPRPPATNQIPSPVRFFEHTPGAACSNPCDNAVGEPLPVETSCYFSCLFLFCAATAAELSRRAPARGMCSDSERK